MEFEQPSIDTGNSGMGGFGCPKTAQKQMINPVNMPMMDPVSLAVSVNIPSMKMPKIGPPMAPLMLKATATNVPIDFDSNARNKQMTPFMTVSVLPMKVALVSETSFPNFRCSGFT